jgi:hypothetical protein
MTASDFWDIKTLEQRGSLLFEDGHRRESRLEGRAQELAHEGWDLITIAPTQRRFRRRCRDTQLGVSASPVSAAAPSAGRA